MFESKTGDLATSTSPPSRGRSPANSEASLHSRPVSKVRASFVAVERPAEAGQGQQWGLRKSSDVGTMADIDEVQLDGTTSSIAAQNQQPANQVNRPTMDEETNGTGESVANEESHTTPRKPAEIDGGLGAILKGSAFEASPSDTVAVGAEDQVATSTKSKPIAKPKPTSQSASLAKRMKDSRTDPPPKGNFIASRNAVPVLPVGGRIRPLMSTKPPTTPKSPLPKTPTSPNIQNKISSPNTATIGDSGKSKSKASLGSPTLTKPDHKSSPPAAPKVTQPTKSKASDTLPTSNGVKKDTSPTSPKGKTRPRSPTRSARPPAAATARTTPSVAKASAVPNHPASQTSTTASAGTRSLATTQPKKSMTKTPNAATASSLAKKASRASLASQQDGHDIPKSRTSSVHKAPAEGFLARMTRPTASFAQKTHEKLQVHSPPRERKPMAKPKLRKSMGKLEDDKENVADTNDIEDHGRQDLAPSTDGGVDGQALQAEIPAQPLAAGQQGAESTRKTS